MVVCGRLRVPVTRVFSPYVVQAGSAGPGGAGRPAPTAFNRAGEKLRATGESCPGLAARLILNEMAGSLSPSAGRKVLGTLTGAG